MSFEPTIGISEIQNTIVLVRTCYDLPNLDDLARIVDARGTILKLLKQGNKVIILSYWGRPDGHQSNDLSLQKMVGLVEEIMEHPVQFVSQSGSFAKTKRMIGESQNRLFLLENTRFFESEQSSDSNIRFDLATQYAQLGTFFVDESFPSSHRTEATNTELKALLPWCHGLSYENELIHLKKLKNNPHKPFVVLLGGAKLETKLPVITHLLPIVDTLLIGGALSFTFLKVQGFDVADSLVEESFITTAQLILHSYSDKIILPKDFIWALEGQNTSFTTLEQARIFSHESGVTIEGVDLGPASVELFCSHLQRANSIFWNGPLGVYERDFKAASLKVAEFITQLDSTYKVLGGGDTNSALGSTILAGFDFVSMGGGATLNYLSQN